MNSRPLDDTLHRVAAETIEELALMFLVPQEDASVSPADSRKTVRVAFTGPFRGELVVTAPESLLSQLAANMLGLAESEEVRPGYGEDALKELANVVCGNLLPAIAGPGPVFRVGAPCMPDDDASLDTEESTAEARVYVEGGAIELTLRSGDIPVPPAKATAGVRS